MREIPSLQVLCLRVVGSHSCSAETTFARDENGQPSAASRLLRSFHQRPARIIGQTTTTTTSSESTDAETKEEDQPRPPLKRTPCIGEGSGRRMQANEVDLHHPFAAAKWTPPADPNSSSAALPSFYMQHGNPALDCLQSFVDALVELGRFDDSRLGVHFFEEWRANVLMAATGSVEAPEQSVASSKKRRRGAASPAPLKIPNHIKGSLSLHNCSFSTETMDAMVESKMAPFVTVLDLSGVNGLSDEMLEKFLPDCRQLEELSIKNCRRITNRGLTAIVEYQGSTLQSLDVGGVYNIQAEHQLLPAVPKLKQLNELHASGLGWSDGTIDKLTEMNDSCWTALSFSFSLQLTQTALRQSLLTCAANLQSISLAFCESLVDNALMAALGRNLPAIRCMDLRGNHSLTTLTGWYDGRVSADLKSGQPLTVLGRYSGLSEASVEETKNVHPFEAMGLIVILDGTGTGLGIMKELNKEVSNEPVKEEEDMKEDTAE